MTDRDALISTRGILDGACSAWAIAKDESVEGSRRADCSRGGRFPNRQCHHHGGRKSLFIRHEGCGLHRGRLADDANGDCRQEARHPSAPGGGRHPSPL